MGLNDLFTKNAELLRDPTRFGEGVIYHDPTTSPATAMPVDAIFEVDGTDPLVRLETGTELQEQGTLELPTSFTVREDGWFTIDGQTWKIYGRGGRDTDLQTILIQHPIPFDKRIARRRS